MLTYYLEKIFIIFHFLLPSFLNSSQVCEMFILYTENSGGWYFHQETWKGYKTQNYKKRLRIRKMFFCFCTDSLISRQDYLHDILRIQHCLIFWCVRGGKMTNQSSSPVIAEEYAAYHSLSAVSDSISGFMSSSQVLSFRLQDQHFILVIHSQFQGKNIKNDHYVIKEI